MALNYSYDEEGNVKGIRWGKGPNYKSGQKKLQDNNEKARRNVKKKEKETKPSNPQITRVTSKGSSGKSEKLPPNLRYPYSTIDDTQDFIKFTIFKYKRDGNITKDTNNLKSDLLGSILLPIPAQLVDSNSAAYGAGNMNFMQDAGLTGGTQLVSGDGEAAGGTANKLIEDLTSGTGGSLLKKGLIMNAINSVGGNLTLEQVMQRSSGQIINPNMELLFSGPTLREFSYQFKFTPRFQKEAETIRTIIKAFKRNMAPKGGGTNFLKTPNIFEIQYVGKASDYLNRIKLCALKNVTMNYTADGTFTTYNDGSPISMNMTLQFGELTPIFNEDYESYDNTDDGVGY
tara:strand:- start:283 stop:1314 length:1032 start_codon:yes stop_codon:yes gene_type:complete